ncbi:hypothetical protein MLD38_025243 [Melastoma candidum]|uniref:Uncharacterized protein n=1 Tax=Melastoma candidum TaxID=119954 RepID=A0ACB9NY90_9MYRT|nr:hypothetical protein MLD38_025243 [Melastoma candidum]
MSMPGQPNAGDNSAVYPLHPPPQRPLGHPRPVLPQPYYIDERDGFISWMRAEFAAANAIIDSLAHHLMVTGDPGEYDGVLASINLRRCNWSSVLYMQQFFPISDVVYELKRAALRRQQRPQQQMRPGNSGRKEYRRWNFNQAHNYNHSHNSNDSSSSGSNSLGSGRVKESGRTNSGEKWGETLRRDEDAKGCNVDGTGETEKGGVSKPLADLTLKNADAVEETVHDNGKSESDKGEACTPNPKEKNHEMKQRAGGIPKTFIANELVEGTMVNSADGLKLYDLLDDAEVRKLLSLVKDLRTAGKNGEFPGQTYVTSKRPMRGHGREIIQLGVAVADLPAEVESLGIHKDNKVEPIPALLQDVVIDHLVRMQITPVKPDSCTIDFYYEGDHSRPRSWPRWYGRPICVLFLTDCDMSFGKTFFTNSHPGEFSGALKLSLLPGSLLVMQEPVADSTKHAIPRISKQRILVTFTKCQPKKIMPVDACLSSPPIAHAPHWGPGSPRPLNQVPPHVSKQLLPVPGTTSSQPALPLRPQISAANSMAPLFVPSLPFPAAVAIPAAPTGWSAVPPRHPAPPHLAGPGTGVFLPPQGPGNPSSPEQHTSSEQSCSASTSPTGKKSDLKKARPEANGSVHGQHKDLTKDEKSNGEGDHAVVSGKQNGTA